MIVRTDQRSLRLSGYFSATALFSSCFLHDNPCQQLHVKSAYRPFSSLIPHSISTSTSSQHAVQSGKTHLSYPLSNAFPAKPPSTNPAIVAPILPFPFLCAVSCAMTAPATAPIMPAPTPRSDVEKCSFALSILFDDFEREASLRCFLEERWAGRSSSDEESEPLLES